MEEIDSFEKLVCWQEARQLVAMVSKLCRERLPKNDFDTRSQITRASVSVMNNIAEGFGRYGKKEFIWFLNIAQSSAIEVQSMTYILEDLKIAPTDEIYAIRNKAEQTKVLVRALMRSLR